MDANPTIPDLVHGLADIAAGSRPTISEMVRKVAETRPRYLWHVVRVKTGEDKQAWEALRKRDYRVYWPNFPVNVRTRSGGCRTVIRSVFPGYQFALEGRDGWEPLRESPHVIGLMRIGERFATLMDTDPDFRKIEEAEARLRNPQTAKPLKFSVGERVKLTKGPFIELWGHVEALDENGRVDVLIELLKRKVRVTASSDQVNPA